MNLWLQIRIVLLSAFRTINDSLRVLRRKVFFGIHSGSRSAEIYCCKPDVWHLCTISLQKLLMTCILGSFIDVFGLYQNESELRIYTYRSKIHALRVTIKNLYMRCILCILSLSNKLSLFSAAWSKQSYRHNTEGAWERYYTSLLWSQWRMFNLGRY